MSKYTGRSLACLVLFLCVMQAYADPLESETNEAKPVLRTAFKLEPLDNLSAEQLDHPVVPALAFAHNVLGRMEREIHDYTCTLVKRERLRGKLEDHQYMFAKVRHQRIRDGKVVVPFSIYLRYLGPAAVKGREAIYVDGQHNNKLIARNGGSGNLKNVTLRLDPRGARAMRSSNWPVMEFGIMSLTQRMIQGARMALDLDFERRECEVRYIEGAKINGSTAKCIQILFPERRENLDFHVGRVFVDDTSLLPIRFSHYTWPAKEGGTPRLMEEYNYLQVKSNVGLTDRDFDYRNPRYSFQLLDDDEISARAARK